MPENFDSSQLAEFATKEGFCLLHTGSGKGKTLIGHRPVRVLDKIPEGKGHFMGYLAYPNPTLKNTIPPVRFYEYEKLWNAKGGVGFKEWKSLIPAFRTSGRLGQSVSKSAYIRKIKEIKKLLAEGEIYQLCYAIRFRKKFDGNPFVLFLKMIEAQPTAFSGYLNAGGFQILSISPERLFKVKNRQIITQPIKGTAPLDQREMFEKGSEKDWAELDMITDLERNDIGKICEYGTLKVSKQRALFQMKNLWHAYSEIQGKLPPNMTPTQIFEAMFPGGSVTGCPKKRAMEYIERLEGYPRNIFTGSIGYISYVHDTPLAMDFSIAIRTALVKGGYLEFCAGSAIVLDSDPEEEYRECLLKAERFLGIL